MSWDDVWGGTNTMTNSSNPPTAFQKSDGPLGVRQKTQSKMS